MVELRCTLSAALIAAAAVAGGASSSAKPSSNAGLEAVEPSIRPGDDFYGYANSVWLKATPLAEGASSVDSTSQLRVLNADRVRELLQAAAQSAPAGAKQEIRQKIGDYYASRLDVDGIEAKGLAPIAGELAEIARIDDRAALATYLGRTLRLDDGSNQQTESLWGVWIHQGFHDPYHYAAHIVQGGLGLPDGDDYLDSSPDRAARREAYRDHIANVLRLAGFDRPEARAERVLELETAIARTHASRADTDDVYKTDNEWSAADFAAKAPGFDWVAFFAAARLIPKARFVVWQPGAVMGGARLVASEPVEVWKDYLRFHLIKHYAAVLPQSASGERGALTSAPAVAAKTQKAVAATEAALGDAVGQLYVATYFPPRAKIAAGAMVENIRAVFRAHLSQLQWMLPRTKAKALAKLAALRIGLGYPEQWIDYSGLAIVRGDAFGNLKRVEEFAYRRELAKLGRRVDPDDWPGQLHPQMVGAVLNISPNSMDFAAGLLQPPYFAPMGDAASNYGSAGAGIAHEIAHSFDELGNQYDAQGRLTRWWSAQDLSGYRVVAARLAAQLDACCPTPGTCAHGKQVLAESAADLAGLAIAHEAYLRSLGGRHDVVKNGLTGEQRFFLAFAQRWRRQQTDAALVAQINSDTHAPPRCRSNLVRNSNAWVRAFGIKPGERLYLAPGDRVRIW